MKTIGFLKIYFSDTCYEKITINNIAYQNLCTNLDHDKNKKNMSALQRNFETICSTLGGTKYEWIKLA